MSIRSMDKRVSKTEVKRDLKMLGIKSRVSLDGKEYWLAVVDIVNALIDNDKIQPYDMKDFDLYKQSRKLPCVRFKRYDDLNARERAAVLHAHSKEDYTLERTKKRYTYCFVNMSPRSLPSTWMEPYSEYMEYELGIDEINIVDTVYFVYKIEERILKKGYNKKRPIIVSYQLVEVDPDTGKKTFKYVVSGGNHRVQAVRNLVRSGKLPSSFKIPAIVQYVADP